MFSSIRARLLCWQAMVLAIVVTGFGGWLYGWLEHSTFKEVDAELLAVAQVLSAQLAEKLEDSPPKPRPISLSSGYLQRFGRKPEDWPYFSIWGADDGILAASSSAAAIPVPDRQRSKPRQPHAWYRRERPGVFEVVLDVPGGTRVLVGKSIRKEQERLDRVLSQVVLAGGAVLGVGLIGGWLLAGRVLRPIVRITAAAESISAANLSQRIDLADTESELGRLAHVLNDAFGRLESSFEQQARFTADASHELRTPVAVICSQTEFALSRPRGLDECRESLAVCQRASARLRSLVENLLILARADAGQLALNRQNLDFRDVVENCVELVVPLAQERGIALHRDLQPAPVVGDAERLSDVVTNLLANAVWYNRPGGTIDVRLAPNGDGAVLTVSDTGIGISAQDQPRVFERFFRADPARAHDRGSSGLGLAICKELVEAHQGTISLTSEPDHGTSVTVHIPQTGIGPAGAAAHDVDTTSSNSH